MAEDNLTTGELKRICHYCREWKLIANFVSKRKCFDCAQLRKCYTCGQTKHINEFCQQSKSCLQCKQEGRAKANKRFGCALRYDQNREAILAQNTARKRRAAPKYKSQQRDYRNAARRRWRDEVLGHYGGKCSCCGETEPFFLTIDHIEDNGSQHRRMVGCADMWKWLYYNRFPEGFRLLCCNCNAGRYRNGGMCPHESKRLGIDNSAVTPLANRQRPFCGGIPSTEDPNQFILSF
jgi:hypothetical protein